MNIVIHDLEEYVGEIVSDREDEARRCLTTALIIVEALSSGKAESAANRSKRTEGLIKQAVLLKAAELFSTGGGSKKSSVSLGDLSYSESEKAVKKADTSETIMQLLKAAGCFRENTAAEVIE